MAKVKLTVVESRCRSGYCAKGDTYLVEDLCPPICHELWHSMYPFIYVLLNDGLLDYGHGKAGEFQVKCPDQGRVIIHGERISDIK